MCILRKLKEVAEVFIESIAKLLEADCYGIGFLKKDKIIEEIFFWGLGGIVVLLCIK